jgi:hypothetical protein
MIAHHHYITTKKIRVQKESMQMQPIVLSGKKTFLKNTSTTLKDSTKENKKTRQSAHVNITVINRGVSGIDVGKEGFKPTNSRRRQRLQRCAFDQALLFPQVKHIQPLMATYTTVR